MFFTCEATPYKKTREKTLLFHIIKTQGTSMAFNRQTFTALISKNTLPL